MKLERSILAVAFVLAVGLIPARTIGETLRGVEILQGTWEGRQIEYLDGEILIGLKSGKTQQDFLSDLGKVAVNLVRPADASGFLKVRVASRTDLFETIESLSKLPSVRYAEPNLVERECAIPNDPYFSMQWPYHNTGQDPPGGTIDADIDAVEGWDITTGAQPVLVGVLDGGLPFRFGKLSHPDLDDSTRFFLGYDFINDDFKPTDDRGHGTHVAGTIAAETNNGIGVSGVCWSAQILAIKVFNENGIGSSEAFRDGCIYAVDHGCRVINYSGGGLASLTKEQAIAYADSQGVLICASAGNEWHGSVIWPAAYSVRYSNVIAVSATDHNDQLSPYSSLGPEVVVSAPGGFGSDRDENDVLSTFPNYRAGLNGTDTSGYGYLAGTSMASPHVAGLAALLISYEPDLTPHLVRQILINSSDDLGPPGFDEEFGWGRINVYNALTELEQVTIVHDPLPDTKDTANDYEVLCDILSGPPLTGSPELHYEAGQLETTVSMQATGQPFQYRAYIPAQPPLTSIEYWLSAANAAGDSSVTDTFSFRVVAHGVRISPTYIDAARPQGSSLWYPLWVVNDGILPDTFDLNVTTGWSSTIYDSSGLVPITHTSELLPGDSLRVLVEMQVPSLPIGTIDAALFEATSRGDVTQVAAAEVVSTVSGSVRWPPLSDDFSVIDSSLWLQVFECTSSNFGGWITPSPSRVMFFDDKDFGGDTLKSQPIDFSGPDPVLLRFYLQRRSPQTSDTLKVDFLDSTLSWINVHTYVGSDPYHLTDYELVETLLPGSANHDGFQIRFISGAAPHPQAYGWAIDDFDIGYLSDYHFQLMPRTRFGTVLAGDTLRSMFTVLNKSNQSDQYFIIPVAGSWNATFWDETGSQQIGLTDYVAPFDSIRIMAKVAVPSDATQSQFSRIEADVKSLGDPSEKRRTNIVTRSAGEAEVIPHVDTFTQFGSFWLYRRDVSITYNASAPSPPDCLNLDGAFDTLLSDFLDLSVHPDVFFSYYYQRGGMYNKPEPGEDLQFEYLNDAGRWITFSVHLGDGPVMDAFEVVTIPLPADALHDQFQFRITSTGSGIGYDDWFVDDLWITASAPAVSVSEDTIQVSLMRGDSTTEQLVIANVGEGVLHYLLEATYESVQFQAADQHNGSFATAAGSRVSYESATGGHVKGEPDNRIGPPANRNSGSGLASGYMWRDSDEPDGPTFQWIDIQSTGTLITGLEDDNFVGSFSIGFLFPFFDKTATAFKLSSNGVIGFGYSTYLESFENQLLPNGYPPNSIVAWCWKDLNILDPTNPGGAVYYRSEANRLIIQYVNYPEYYAAAGAVINAEMILKPDGSVTLQYLSIGSGFETTDCTVGMEDFYGSSGVTVVFNNQYLHDSLAVQLIRASEWLTLSTDTGSLGAGEADTVELRFSAIDLDSGEYRADIVVTSNDPLFSSDPPTVAVRLDVAWGFPLVCGDFDLDGWVNVLDLTQMVDYLFKGGSPPPRPGGVDVNGDGSFDVADLTYIVDYFFRGGPDPVC